MSAVNRSKLWVIGGVLLGLVLAVATYMLVISPARSEVASVQSQVEDASMQQVVLRHKLRDLETAAQGMGALKAKLAGVATALPPTVDSQGLLRRIQALATAAGVTVDSVGFGKSASTDVEGVWSVPVAIDLSGPVTGLLAVLADLQSGDGRLITVDDSSVTQPVPGSYHLSLSTKTYATSPSSAADAGAATGAGAAASSGGAPASGPAGTAAN